MNTEKQTERNEQNNRRLLKLKRYHVVMGNYKKIVESKPKINDKEITRYQRDKRISKILKKVDNLNGKFFEIFQDLDIQNNINSFMNGNGFYFDEESIQMAMEEYDILAKKDVMKEIEQLNQLKQLNNSKNENNNTNNNNQLNQLKINQLNQPKQLKSNDIEIINPLTMSIDLENDNDKTNKQIPKQNKTDENKTSEKSYFNVHKYHPKHLENERRIHSKTIHANDLEDVVRKTKEIKQKESHQMIEEIDEKENEKTNETNTNQTLNFINKISDTINQRKQSLQSLLENVDLLNNVSNDHKINTNNNQENMNEIQFDLNSMSENGENNENKEQVSNNNLNNLNQNETEKNEEQKKIIETMIQETIQKRALNTEKQETNSQMISLLSGPENIFDEMYEQKQDINLIPQTNTNQSKENKYRRNTRSYTTQNNISIENNNKYTTNNWSNYNYRSDDIIQNQKRNSLVDLTTDVFERNFIEIEEPFCIKRRKEDKFCPEYDFSKSVYYQFLALIESM